MALVDESTRDLHPAAMTTTFAIPQREPHEPTTVFVQRALRTAIITHRIEAGEMLSEQEVARRFATSRQPVREAFIKLSEAGLVQVLPQRGTRVARISLGEIEDARFVRQAVEIAVASEAARRIDEPGRGALARHLAEQRATVEQEQVAREASRERFFFLDEAFHAELAAIARRPAAWRFLEPVKAQMDRVRFLAVEQTSPLRIIIEQHTAIAAAVGSGDPVAAAAAMAAHLTSILGELPDLCVRFPRLFTDDR